MTQREHIKNTLQVLHRGRPFEVRILEIPGRGKPHQASGYFDDVDAAAEAVLQFDQQRAPGGCYTVLNEINPALLARSPNTLTEFPKHTTTDSEIIRRRWLFIDCDPVRPAGVSSTDEEAGIAYLRANEVFDYLRGAGLPESILARSGNGAHVLTPIDEPNDDGALKMVTGLLAAVARRFGKDAIGFSGPVTVDIDQKVGNAARLVRLYGTTTRKGVSTADRPHRLSELAYVPDFLEAVR